MQLWLCNVVLLIGVTATMSSAHAQQVLVGAAKVDITPTQSVVLAGYGGRTAEFDGIDMPLWARAMVIGGEAPVGIVVVDNCGVPQTVVARIEENCKALGIAPDRLIVAATHTHNAPTLDGYAKIVWAGRTTPQQRQHIEQYTTKLVDGVTECLRQAMAHREPMQLRWSYGRVNFGGNRRVLNNGQWAGFGFQQDGPVDHRLPLLAAYDQSGNLKAAWVNYACHCTTVGSRNTVGGDWAGLANQFIESDHPGVVSLTSIGFGADVGPQPSGDLKIAATHGRQIADEVSRLLKTPMHSLGGEPQVQQRRVQLPLEPPPPRAYWQQRLTAGGFHGQLAHSMIAKFQSAGSIPQDVDYKISVWKFDDQLAMVFMGGEVVVDYSVLMSERLDWRRLWLTGWADSMPGYIPSRRVLNEGGYEPDFSQVYYDLPGRYAPEIQDIIVDAVAELLGETYSAAPDQPANPFHQFPSGADGTFRKIARWATTDDAEKSPLSKRELAELVRQSIPAIAKVTHNDGEQTQWFDFAGDRTPRKYIRQEHKAARLLWQLPQDSSEQETSTFCFVGGVGWITQPQTEGFEFSINGKSQLKFDVTLQRTTWMSEDQRCQLHYFPTWTSQVDSAGFFFVKVHASLLSRQQPNFAGVHSIGSGSLRWFSIEEDQKVPERLKRLAAALSGADASEDDSQ